MSEYNCKNFKFKRFKHVSGFIAFDHNNNSVGFDEVCDYIEKLQQQLGEAEKVIEFYANEADLFDDYDNKGDRSTVFDGNLGVEVLGKRAREYQHKHKDE